MQHMQQMLKTQPVRRRRTHTGQPSEITAVTLESDASTCDTMKTSFVDRVSTGMSKPNRARRRMSARSRTNASVSLVGWLK